MDIEEVKEGYEVVKRKVDPLDVSVGQSLSFILSLYHEVKADVGIIRRGHRDMGHSLKYVQRARVSGQEPDYCKASG